MKPFNVGVLGIGDISDVYISNLKTYDIVSVVACAGRDLEKARRKADAHGLPKAYATAAELISDPHIDIVLNLTLPAVHAELTTMALEAGKHVYTEKPLAATYVEGERILALAKERGLSVCCAPDTFLGGKEAVLREIEAPILLAPIEETLAVFREALEAKFKLVNERIARGENKYIKLKAAGEKRCWSLIYPIEEEPINSSFYSQLPGIGIANLLWFVATKTGFLRAFTHVLDRYVKQSPDPREIFACIVAMGTNMGLWKMAEVSGLSYDSLLTTARNFLRLETVHAGNDAICNATAALPAFHHYDIHDELHSSSDGQRFETQINTINARYSRKYFTLKKGVSAYTLVLNHAPINAKVIGTHEHESHYVYDLLHNNTTDIKPERHSTDTHGSNQVNFWILHVFGYRFAPRYRDLYKRMDTLVGFMHPNHYKDFLISPCARYSTR